MARLLLDENLPRSLCRHLLGHECSTVGRQRWQGIRNGVLLRRAASEFDVLITMDRSIPHQQDVSAVDIAVIVVRASANNIASLRPLVPALMEAIDRARPGMVEIVAG